MKKAWYLVAMLAALLATQAFADDFDDWVVYENADLGILMKVPPDATFHEKTDDQGWDVVHLYCDNDETRRHQKVELWVFAKNGPRMRILAAKLFVIGYTRVPPGDEHWKEIDLASLGLENVGPQVKCFQGVRPIDKMHFYVFLRRTDEGVHAAILKVPQDKVGTNMDAFKFWYESIEVD